MGRAHSPGRLLCGGPGSAGKGRWCCSAGLASIVSCMRLSGVRCEGGVGACVCKQGLCLLSEGRGALCLRGGSLDRQQQARRDRPGRPERMRQQLPHSRWFRGICLWDPQRWGAGEEEVLEGAGRETASFHRVSGLGVCTEGVAHSRRRWVELVWPHWPLEVSGHREGVPVAVGNGMVSVKAHPSSLK